MSPPHRFPFHPSEKLQLMTFFSFHRLVLVADFTSIFIQNIPSLTVHPSLISLLAGDTVCSFTIIWTPRICTWQEEPQGTSSRLSNPDPVASGFPQLILCCLQSLGQFSSSSIIQKHYTHCGMWWAFPPVSSCFMDVHATQLLL